MAAFSCAEMLARACAQHHLLCQAERLLIRARLRRPSTEKGRSIKRPFELFGFLRDCPFLYHQLWQPFCASPTCGELTLVAVLEVSESPFAHQLRKIDSRAHRTRTKSALVLLVLLLFLRLPESE
eukprot:s2191_g7.t1